MTRAEKIQQAWAELGLTPVFANDLSSEFSGWSKFSPQFKLQPSYDPSKLDFITIAWCRPKSLNGIESNNGWISIESEDHFDSIPNGNYHWYNIDSSIYDIGDKHYFGKHTHYQPIVIPKNPLY